MAAEQKPAFPIMDGPISERILSHDWELTPIGPLENWPHSLRIATNLVLSTRFPTVVMWGPELTVCAYNEAYAPLLREKPEALGQPFLDVWPETRVVAAPQLEQVLRGKAIFHEDACFRLKRYGKWQDVYFDYCYSPLHGDDGAVAGVLHTTIETTARVRTALALQEFGVRQNFLLRLGDALRSVQDAAEIQAQACRMLGEYLGVARVGFGEMDDRAEHVTVHRDWNDGRVPSFRGRWRLDDFGPRLVNTLRRGHTTVIPDIEADARTCAPEVQANFREIRVRAVVGVPLIRGSAMVAVMFLHHPEPRAWSPAEVQTVHETCERLWDAVERARAEAALRERDERLRVIVESARDYAIFTTDVANRIDTWLPGAEHVFGWTEQEALGRHADILFTPEDRAQGVPEQEVTEARERGVAQDMRWHIRKDGTRVFIEGSTTAITAPVATPGRGSSPPGPVRGFLKIGRDVTERKAAENREALLTQEVDHRAKNALALVQAMLRLTKADDPWTFAQTVTGRVEALARAQTLLSEHRWDGASLERLLHGELSAFVGEQRATLQGPPVILPVSMTQPLAMVFHELATNALEYGALSAAGGKVLVQWDVQEHSAPLLHLRWEERGGPEVAGAPTRQGFGMHVLLATLRDQLGGSVSLDWRSTGLICEIEVPLD